MRKMGLKKRGMLDYFKTLLSAISFSTRLFRKEYRKSFKYLAPAEQQELKQWIRTEKLRAAPSGTEDTGPGFSKG